MARASKKEKGPLAWNRAVASALLSVALILVLSIVVNGLIGRTIHWDIVAVLGGVGFLGLTLAFRYVL